MISSLRYVQPLAALVAWAFCVGPASATPKHLAPIPAATLALMAARDTGPAAPILMRSYKKESELEVWKLARNGRYVLLKTFPVCRWSGQLGPKSKVGDRQTPEGFYSVTPGQMNPNSAYHLSFDLGYPNAYDRAHGGTGSHLMVHGTCSSMGCFAMTDRQVGEIYALAREAFEGGQKAFQYQSFPFRMTAQNLARHRTDKHIGFWRQLKEGADRFEATGQEVAVGVQAGRYIFAPLKDLAREALVKARRTAEDAKFAQLVDDGVAAVRTTYSDGGQHASFAVLARLGSPALGEISRPEALALAGREIVVIPARKKPAPIEVAAVPLQPMEVAAARLQGLAGDAKAARAAGAEPSLFAAARLDFPPGGAPVPGPLISGAATILASALARGPYRLAAR